MNDWKSESQREAAVAATLAGATLGGGIALARGVSNISEKAAHADQVRRINQRAVLRDEVIAEILALRPAW